MYCCHRLCGINDESGGFESFLEVIFIEKEKLE
jgi:hypothetical protein